MAEMDSKIEQSLQNASQLLTPVLTVEQLCLLMSIRLSASSKRAWDLELLVWSGSEQSLQAINSHCTLCLWRVESVSVWFISHFSIFFWKQINKSVLFCSYNYRTRVQSLGMLVTHSLTHSLTNWLLFSQLDWCDPGVWGCQLKTCWGCYCCWCW